MTPTAEQARILQPTLQEHTACFHQGARPSFETGCRTGVEVHTQREYPLPAAYPDLPAPLVWAARVKARQALKSALTWKHRHGANAPRKGAKAEKAGRKPPTFQPVKAPISVGAPLRYDARSSWVKGSSLTWSLPSVAGPQQMSVTVPTHARQDSGWKAWSADLCFHHEGDVLHVVVSHPAPSVAPSEEGSGVDPGVTRPAGTSNRDLLGDPHCNEQQCRLFRLRRTLQSKGTNLQSKGTTSATRHLKKRSGHLCWQRREHDHVLRKSIVHHATPGSTIMLENLTTRRERVTHRKGEGQRPMHGWSFAQFWSLLSSKAEARGIAVVNVAPRHTSHTCSRCGHQARTTRRSQALFLCRSCGDCLNADLTASTHSRDKHLACLASLGRSFAAGYPVKVPLLSDLRV